MNFKKCAQCNLSSRPDCLQNRNGMNNMTTGFRHLAAIVALCSVFTLGACSKLSDVGQQQQVEPQAKASALSQPFTRDDSGNITLTVRAGADVVLSGKDSLKSPDDTGLPLLNFKWEQSTSDSVVVQVIARTSNTSSFTAPEVTQDTALHFTLTVANAKGTTASATATVLVKPIRDNDRFLQYLHADNTFPSVIATQAPVAPDSSAAVTDTLPLTVTLTKLVSFTDRNGVVHTRVPVGKPVMMSASWSAQTGTSSSCSADENPKLRLPIPRINTDDVLNAPISGYPDAVILGDVLEASDIDGVTLEVQIDLSSSSAAVATAVPVICINGGATASASATVVDTESLYANNIPRDSRASSQAYFNAIDPGNDKDTMDKWLAANGFDTSADGWNADAHAVYTNNFDLGFGRNMYLKYGACDSGFDQLPLQQRIGHCDVAAIVVNYADLEAAIKKLNPIMAVAMEYSASPGGGPRFTKFYTFAPDTRTGVFHRVMSVDLDRRGQEYMPQACVVCHGGTPGNATSYAASADLNAGFIPWDLDSFLFTDNDQGFTNKPANAALKSQYSRAAQEAQLKKLNEGAYLTFADPAATPGRFALARELMEKWYGGAGLPSDTYNDDAVPAGWEPGGVANNPADSDKIYKQVFARHCRNCHVLQIPAMGDPRTATITPQGAAVALDACSDNPLLVNSSVGAASQVPMGCYWEFAHAPDLATNLGTAQMPFARRTTDRMWMSDGASQSPAQLLQTHLFNTEGITVPTPGVPVACIDNFGTPISGQTAVEVARHAWVQLGSSCSHYLNAATWTLTAPAGSHAVLVGADTTSPKFQTDLQGDYTLMLTDESGVSSATATARVLVAAPSAGSDTRNVVLDSTGAASIDVDVMQLSGSQSRDPLSALNITGVTGITASVQSVTSTSAVLHVNISSLAGGVVTYTLTDSDGDQSGAGTITVNVSASIVANDATVTVNTNGSGVINLSNLVSAAAQPYTLSIQTQPAVNRGRGTGSVTAPVGGNVTYTAPPGVTSHIGATLISAQSIDSFEYRACFSAQPAVCDTGTVTVNLRGSSTFNGVVLQMGTICSLCHSMTPPVGGAVGDANPNYIIQDITDTTTLAPYDTVNARKAFYCMLMTNAPLNESTGAAYINIASPASSFIYLKPQGMESHGGGTLYTDTSVPPLSTFYNWINEGAYFTESANQSCP